MLKVLFLLALLALVKSSVDDFYGKWTPVMIFSLSNVVQVCIKLEISKHPSNIQCTCDGGRKATFTLLQHLESVKNPELYHGNWSFPFLEATNVADVMSAFNTSCTCGEYTYKHGIIGRSINENYKVMYQPNSNVPDNNIHSQAPNDKIIIPSVIARNVDTQPVLEINVQRDQELKEKEGVIVCTKESPDFRP